MELSDLEKARAVMSAAAGRIQTNEDFEIAVCGCKSAGMSDTEICSYLSQSPKFDTEAKIRVKSFKAEGGRSLGSLVKWAKDTIGFIPSWHHDRLSLADYPAPNYAPIGAIAENAPENAQSQTIVRHLPKYKPLPLPFKYDNLDAIEQLKIWAQAVRTDAELTQIAAGFSGSDRKTALISLAEMQDAASFADIEKAIGAKFAEDTGAWVMINPVHDENGKNESVSAYKYLLWEADEGTFETQWGAIKQSRAPVDAVVFSGAKSLHAWVRIDAENAEEYADLARRFFDVLDAHGANYDKSTKNPGRLCRLPGIMRGQTLQRLIAVRADFPNAFGNIKEWLEWEETPHILPHFSIIEDDMLADMSENIIGDVIQRGDIVCLGGDQKIGKSWIIEQLAAELIKPIGGNWLGMPIAPKKDGSGYRVYFANAEIKDQVFCQRMGKVMTAAHSKNFCYNLAHITLRNVMENISRWKSEMVAQIKKHRADIVIIDPIYTLIDGDENSSEDIRRLMIILRQIAEETGTTMIITHHHRKGDMELLDIAQRLAGSNVIARFVDTIIDLSGINPDYLRAGGIETAIPGSDGIKRLSVRGLRLEYMLRNTADIAPRYFWRYDGGNFAEDKTGCLELAWHKKQKTAFSAYQISASLSLLGSRVALSSFACADLREEQTQSETSDTLIETRLKEAASAGVGLSAKTIADLTGLSEKTVRAKIADFRANGLVIETNPERGYHDQALYSWIINNL